MAATGVDAASEGVAIVVTDRAGVHPAVAGLLDRAIQLAPDLYGHRETRARIMVGWLGTPDSLAAVLRQAPEGLRYLGLMGSRRKVARVREELAASS